MTAFSLGRVRTALFILISTILAGACASKGPMTRIGLNDLLEDIEKKSYLIKQFRVEFVKTRHSSVFDRELSVRGLLIYQKPDSFRLSLTGDVHMDILSDGKLIRLIHDHRDEETYHVMGERDMAKFTDPLMLLIDGIGNGALRRFQVTRYEQEGDRILIEVEPGNGNHFERIKSAILRFSILGDILSVDINFKNGDVDRTVFESWFLVSDDDPEILQMKKLLKRIRPAPTLGVSGPWEDETILEAGNR